MNTVVIFRKFKDDGSVCAFFPYEIATYDGCISSYMHVGQHGSASYDCCVDITKPASPNEYKPLLKELRSIGYRNLQVRKKRSHSKYLKAYYSELARWSEEKRGVK